jgi:hypothetical protein
VEGGTGLVEEGERGEDVTGRHLRLLVALDRPRETMEQRLALAVDLGQVMGLWPR